MKQFLDNLSINIVCISFIVASVILATKGIGGWGWFVFGALLTARGSD